MNKRIILLAFLCVIIGVFSWSCNVVTPIDYQVTPERFKSVNDAMETIRMVLTDNFRDVRIDQSGFAFIDKITSGTYDTYTVKYSEITNVKIVGERVTVPLSKYYQYVDIYHTGLAYRKEHSHESPGIQKFYKDMFRIEFSSRAEACKFVDAIEYMKRK